MLYPVFKKILFRLDPETAHHLSLNSLQLAHTLGLTKFFRKPAQTPCTLMGLSFPNPVGLAAGFDKNGDYIDALASLGFGFIEIGTVTPKPQAGNPRPRLFRLSEYEAIINQLGFNNKGVDYLIERLKKTRFKGVLGINIGKNRDTPLDNAVDDYIFSFRRVAPYASYITINISSPNTPELRKLQHGDLLQNLLRVLKKEQRSFVKKYKKYLPLVVKISPDLTLEELQTIANTLLSEKIDGVIATNTTIERPFIKEFSYKNLTGGLSGKPLFEHSTYILRNLKDLLFDKIPLIASGGIFSEQKAREKMHAGAKLIQIYTGLIYQGPKWIVRLVESLRFS